MGFTFQIGDLGLLISVALMLLGVRLLRLAHRNRSAPELLIGLYLLLSPPATSLVMRVPRFDPAHHEMLRMVAFLGLAVSASCLAAFAWRVFRPDVAWAKGLVAALVFYYLGLCAATLLLGSTRFDLEMRTLAMRIALLVTYVWVFVECALHRRLLVRRLRLGLADPVVVNRFLLFEVWSGVLAVLPGVTLLLATLLDPTTDAYGPLFARVVRITGFAIYAAMWLSFLPPRAYTRWLERRNQQRHPDGTALEGI